MRTINADPPAIPRFHIFMPPPKPKALNLMKEVKGHYRSVIKDESVLRR